ncbi:MAG TPA: type II toxin-antitoxin system Phd/YefM family antitoxin [Thermoanaerobaculia bacterium]|nr:type II toxin-antitoxin system Phd/YefM family antitoxin [Thermoanaerobaculia bacterium]
MARIPSDLPEDIHPAAELRSIAEKLLEQVRATRRPVVLTEEGKGAAVLVDLESYRTLLDELDLLRDVHRGLADVEAGRVVPHEEARFRLLNRYK